MESGDGLVEAAHGEHLKSFVKAAAVATLLACS